MVALNFPGPGVHSFSTLFNESLIDVFPCNGNYTTTGQKTHNAFVKNVSGCLTFGMPSFFFTYCMFSEKDDIPNLNTFL